MIVTVEDCVQTLSGAVPRPRVVLTNGVFDILHIGHLTSLEQAKSFGDVLIVAVNSDSSARTLNKGRHRPVVPQRQRAAMVSALKPVDYVVLFDEPTPRRVIETLAPDVYSKGGDYSVGELRGPDGPLPPDFRGEVRCTGLVRGWSSSGLLADVSGTEPSGAVVRQGFEIVEVLSNVCTVLGDQAAELARDLTTALVGGRRVFLFGNGGSAAEAEHFAAELIVRFAMDRRALPAICLSGAGAVMTAIGNDYGFEHVFSRQLCALAGPGDVAVGFTVSGKSANVVRGIAEARARGARTWAITGAGLGPVVEAADRYVAVPSLVTARVQEAHLFIIHAVCSLIDDAVKVEQ